LDGLIASTQLQDSLSDVNIANQSTPRVMIYDLLFGKHKSIVGGGALKRVILESEAELRAALERLRKEKAAKTDDDLLPSRLRNTVVLPRYIRVNLLLTTVADAVTKFTKEGWIEVSAQVGLERLATETARKWSDKLFWKDQHLDDLLVFPPGTDFHDDSWVATSKLILQDKASALGGACLQPPPSPSTVALDACAAPGQKTVQLCQHMNNLGTLIAIEQDTNRYRTLLRLGRARGMKNLAAFNRSFLDINPEESPFSNVEYILLDPSCSGSGIVNRLDYTNANDEQDAEDDDTSERLKSLSEFQYSAIMHAFKFPRLRRLVYSTCSVHDIENEMVVERALETAPPGWKLVPIATQFPSRGKPLFPDGPMCVRTVPETDRTIGFFVSCFERDPGMLPPPVEASAQALQAAEHELERPAKVQTKPKKRQATAPPAEQPKPKKAKIAAPPKPPAPTTTQTQPVGHKKKKKLKNPKPIMK
jgi:25S rRNA (cytosine2278-C5)-methyltransferase